MQHRFGAVQSLALCLVAALALAATPARAGPGEVVVYATGGSFADAAFALESAIIGRGLVVDHVSHVGEMLSRTAEDVGATEQVYNHADVYLFCSATLSRKMMEADPANIAHCPYSIFLYELAADPGEAHVGYRRMPEGEMQEVESLLDRIARDVADF